MRLGRHLPLLVAIIALLVLPLRRETFADTFDPLIAALCRELDAGRAIAIDYSPGWRIVEPHAIGRGANGQPLLRAWQISGASESGGLPAWRLFRLDRIGAWRPTADRSGAPRPGYNFRGDRQIPAVTCMVR
jgi:hypothetical protein